MTRRVKHLSAPVAAFAVLALTFTSSAMADAEAVLWDCLNTESVEGHSDADKRAALKQLPADAAEYSECRSIIEAALGTGKSKQPTAGIAGASRAGRGGKSDRKPETPAAQLAHATAKIKRTREATEKSLGQRTINPRGAGVLDATRTTNGLPIPILLALIALSLVCCAGALVASGRRVPGLVGAINRVFRRRADR